MHDLPQLSDVLVDVAKKLFRSLVLAQDNTWPRPTTNRPVGARHRWLL